MLGHAQLEITGAPRTKKTSNVLARAGRRRVVLPSKAWRRWCREAEILYGGSRLEELLFPDEPLNCCAYFYRDAKRGDAVGYYQGLADLLEKREVVSNDAQIISWDGSRLMVDRESPRTEVLLEVIG